MTNLLMFVWLSSSMWSAQIGDLIGLAIVDGAGEFCAVFNSRISVLLRPLSVLFPWLSNVPDASDSECRRVRRAPRCSMLPPSRKLFNFLFSRKWLCWVKSMQLCIKFQGYIEWIKNYQSLKNMLKIPWKNPSIIKNITLHPRWRSFVSQQRWVQQECCRARVSHTASQAGGDTSQYNKNKAKYTLRCGAEPCAFPSATIYLKLSTHKAQANHTIETDACMWQHFHFNLYGETIIFNLIRQYLYMYVHFYKGQCLTSVYI